MKRRMLQFASLDDAVADARRLHTAGYERAGQWSLAQNLEHLTIFLNKSLDGFGEIERPLMIRLFGPWLIKPLMLAMGRMPAGVEGPRPLMPLGTGDDASQLAAFEAAVARVNAAGAFQPSPFLGRLRSNQWRRLHCIHAAHHLSFLVPKV